MTQDVSSHPSTVHDNDLAVSADSNPAASATSGTKGTTVKVTGGTEETAVNSQVSVQHVSVAKKH